MNETPLYDALSAYSRENPARFHMPGHKGRLSYDLNAAYDVTELPFSGNLYEGTGPIAQSQSQAARSFGARSCLYLTGGATQGIYASMSAACPPESAVLIDRGCHRSVYNAMALLDLRPVYLFPERIEEFCVNGPARAEQVERLIKENPDIAAVVLTSPTYYGVLSDIEAVSRVCARYGAALIVDQAHGAHLAYLEGFQSAAAQGADLLVTSFHKTMPALGQAAAVFTGTNRFSQDRLREAAALFGTSSPSYLIMLSIELAVLSGPGAALYAQAVKRLQALKNKLEAETGFAVLRKAGGMTTDPLRLTVCTAAGGIGGYEAEKALRDRGVYVEMADTRNLVAICAPNDTEAELNRLYGALAGLTEAGEQPVPDALMPQPVAVMSPRQAAFCPEARVSLSDAGGRIAKAHIAAYPPGIPVVAAGELISEKHLAYLKQMRYNMNTYVKVCV